MIKTPLSTVIGGAFWTPSATILGSTSNTFDQIIKSLFANSEQGFFYDPNDLSTMFQDAAGTVPVTGAGQPVGLMLDKSKGVVLGGELASVTSVTSVPIGGQSTTTYPIANVQRGRPYQITFKVTNYQGSADVGVAGPTTNWLDNGTVFSNGNGTVRCTRTFIGSGGIIHLYTRSVNQCIFTDISVKELPGNHASQTTSASRPILRQNATTGAYYLEFDGSDDYLIVAKDNLKFLHDGTGATGFVGFKPSGAVVYHTLLNTGNLGGATTVGYALAQDDRAGNGNILNMVTNGSGTMLVSNIYKTGISANPRVVSFKNKIGTHALRLNGMEVLNTSTETGAPNTTASTNDLWIGRAPSGFSLHGNLYGLVCINRLTIDSETAAIEKELSKRMGVTLNV